MSRQTKDMCLIPGGLHSPPERAKGISDDEIWAMQKSAEAIVVVLGNEGKAKPRSAVKGTLRGVRGGVKFPYSFYKSRCCHLQIPFFDMSIVYKL